MRLSAVVAVVIALAAAWPVKRSLLLAGQQGERLAVVDVTVVDQKGSPVSDLGRDEFELLVDGERRSVESVGVDVPRRLDRSDASRRPIATDSRSSAPRTRIVRSDSDGGAGDETSALGFDVLAGTPWLKRVILDPSSS